MGDTISGVGGEAFDLCDTQASAFGVAFHVSPVRMVYCDRNLVIREVNAACLQVEGLSRSQMVGRSLEDIYGPALRDARRPSIEAVLRGEPQTAVEWGLRRATRGRLLRIRHEPVWDAAGEVIGFLVMMEDKTDLHELEKRVSMQEDVIRQTSDALAVVGADYRYHWVNPAYAMIWKRTPEEVIGLTVPDIIGNEGFRGRVLPRLTSCFNGEVTQYEFSWPNGNGGSTQFAVRLEPLRDDNGDIVGAVVNMRDITEAAILNRRLRRQALEDALTGLANRYALEAELARRIERCLKTPADCSNCSAALLLVDLDDFKVVNDLAGHIAGDALLRQVASLLRTMDPAAVVARLGGDEFALIVDGLDEAAVTELGERIVAAVEGSGFTWKGDRFSVGASIGAAMLDTEAFTAVAPSVHDIINSADRACLVAKEKGGARVCVFHPDDGEMHARFEEIGNLQVVQTALQEGRFALHVMPIAPVDGHSEPFHEVLLRVIGEGGRALPPQVFITAAERHGLMNRVDRWVVETALARMPALPQDARLTINLSGQSVGDPVFRDFLLETLDRAKVTPGRLAFEITETSAVRSMETAQDLIASLKKRGFGVILDDFGSGLSSFGYLRNFDVDMLKIDGNIIGSICEDKVQQTIVAGIVAVATAMRVRVVAEYVEDEATMEILRELGVSLVQGYFIGKPAPWDEVFPV
ncbi:putative bifunctional diguanylate cyclase/phosphodiesterase [Stappia sp.]|uniref:putative bifunctional diguanylate cyclase/phosphodiesterase n=1 Tax=Stappia sp. TaxID=1870903 RepID=UPI003A994CA5